MRRMFINLLDQGSLNVKLKGSLLVLKLNDLKLSRRIKGTIQRRQLNDFAIIEAVRAS
jgi:hypothetical protein